MDSVRAFNASATSATTLEEVRAFRSTLPPSVDPTATEAYHEGFNAFVEPTRITKSALAEEYELSYPDGTIIILYRDDKSYNAYDADKNVVRLPQLAVDFAEKHALEALRLYKTRRSDVATHLGDFRLGADGVFVATNVGKIVLRETKYEPRRSTTTSTGSTSTD